MAESETAIINTAMIHIGEDTISNRSSDNSTRARKADQRYDPVRRALLRRYRWNFAIKRTTLASSGTPDFGFTYKFPLPDDNIQFLGIYDANEPAQNYTSSTIPYKNEGNNILCDEASLPIFYVSDVTNTALFDPTFDEAFGLDLAKDLAYALSTGLKRVEQITRDFKEAIKEARLSNAISTQPEIMYASEWLDAHDGSQRTQRLRIGPIN